MKLWLDDRILPPNEDVSSLEPARDWVVVQDPLVFRGVLPLVWPKLTVISFDHDMQCFRGDREYTGYTAMTWIEEWLASERLVDPIPVLCVHTSNAAMYHKMQDLANALMNRYRVRKAPVIV